MTAFEDRVLADLADIRRALYGNGQAGLVERITRIEERTPKTARTTGGIAGVITGAITAVIT